MKICKVSGCKNRYWAKGYCNTHYKRLYRTGKVLKIIPVCVVKGCINKHHAKGFCNIHWHKQYYQKHKKERAEYSKRYLQTPAGKMKSKAADNKRRLLESTLTKENMQQVYEDNIKKYGTLTCILCNKPIKFGEDSLEHLTPLSRGGTNNYNNLGVSHKNCNIKKHTKTMKEYFKLD